MPKARYFDYAATTPLDEKVLKAMLPYLTSEFGNPSNLYSLGFKAKKAVEKATAEIAEILNCRPDEIIYTGGATEADNLALLGVAKRAIERLEKKEKLKIITSQIEHKGILAVCDKLEKEAGLPMRQGFEIVRLPVGKTGLVDLEALKKELDEHTVLVSITYADSETGTIQPISEISKILKNFKIHNTYPIIHTPYFHTDASQAAGYLDMDVERLGVDMMTLSAHKTYGPKGIGALYVKKRVEIEPLIYGGGQQKIRSGTENVPGIVGFAEALKLVRKEKKKESAGLKKMRDTLEKGILKSIPKTILNGHPQNRLPNFLNVSILDVEGEALLLHLDELGIMVSTGSACNSQSLEPSYILSALGHPYEYIHGSLRFTLGRGNEMEDVKYVLKVLPEVVQKLRAVSPLNLELHQTEKISDPRAFIGNQTPHFLRKKHK